MTNVAGFSSKSKGNIKYPNLPSAIRLIPNSVDLPTPLFTSLPTVVDEPVVSSTSDKSCLEDDCYEPLADNQSSILITQAFLSGLVRGLTRQKTAELLGSRLQHNNTFLLPTQHVPGTSEEKKIWYNIFPRRKHLCFVAILPVFFKRWGVYMTH